MLQIMQKPEGFTDILNFEDALAMYTCAPYVVTTDCCTHAIELCLRYLGDVDTVTLPAHSYISVVQTLRMLNIDYQFRDYQWKGSYDLEGTPIVDSAIHLAPNMYVDGKMICLSFGNGKPLALGRGGAILLDDEKAYEWLSRARSDGIDLNVLHWEEHDEFEQGYHYRFMPREARRAIEMLPDVDPKPKDKQYPDLRKIRWKK